ncbi:MAG: beta-ketoacyl-[acyl-carrier-protein] synthase family protein [Planctomycetia bacterium]
MSRPRVVVTGLGMVTPLGADAPSTWRGLCDGRRAVRRVDLPLPAVAGGGRRTLPGLGAPALFPVHDETCELETACARGRGRAGDAGRCLERARDRGFGLSVGRLPAATAAFYDSLVAPLAGLADYAPAGWAGDDAEEPDRLLLAAGLAAREAMIDAGFADPDQALPTATLTPALAERFGCVLGSSKGSLDAALTACGQLAGHDAVDPRLWLLFQPGTTAALAAARWGLYGPSDGPVAACATGLQAVLTAADWIADGRCDAVLAGAADASLSAMVVGSYQRLGVLAPWDAGGDPGEAVRPFDRHRRGFAVGEGAAVFVLESAEHAAKRGAPVYAELAGWVRGGAGRSITAMTPEPTTLVHCLQRLWKRAEVSPEAVGHVHLHGTATADNDPWETAALRAAFGDHARRLQPTAVKGSLGHLLGAAGGVEFAATLLALLHQFAPPTVNLFDRDPACDLDFSPTGRPCETTAALKLSYGFGGHLAAALTRRPTDLPLKDLHPGSP